jgi:hypothetical protein
MSCFQKRKGASELEKGKIKSANGKCEIRYTQTETNAVKMEAPRVDIGGTLGGK